MIVHDSSVLICHLWPRDRHHEAADAVLRAHVDVDNLIHPINLAEVLVGGVRSGTGTQMRSHIQEIGVRVWPVLSGEPLRLATLRATSGLKLPDCCALDAAMSTGSSLATFDGRLADAARGLGLDVVPLP